MPSFFVSMLSFLLSTPVLLSDGGFNTLKCELLPMIPMKARQSAAPRSVMSPAMARLEQSERIGSLEEKLTALKDSQNRVRDRYYWASSYFKKHKIPLPDPWEILDVIPPLLHPVQVHDSATNAIREMLRSSNSELFREA
jgi:hypothetical protein